MDKRIVIFDFDGVIVDSFDHSYSRGVRQWPDLLPHDYKNFFKGNVFESMAQMPPSPANPEEMSLWLQNEYFPSKKKLPIFPGIKKVIQQLSQNNVLVINTSSLEKEVREYLNENSLGSYFDKVYDSEVSKDKVKKFEQILKDYSIDANGCIFITDTVGDVLEAYKCNIPTIAVTYGYHDKPYFDLVKDKVIGFSDKPLDILNIITC